MTINPLPQFEEDLALYLKEKADRDAYEGLNVPSTIVVRFGYNRMVGEFPYYGEGKPGCGSKLVIRTQRGTEIGEMLTSTCQNSGCSKSVTRKEMLSYIENSGGRKYPFFDQGKVVRIATKQDLDDQGKLEESKQPIRAIIRSKIRSLGLEMRLVEVEPILGGERMIVYFNAEDRVDFRDLVKGLQNELSTRVELIQVGARDEARIVADYERCGQYCCCKNFLKVLKPISMKSAKIQKATLDPLKISGRCGRLMCCLRYEDETYEELRKNLPHRKSRVGTPEGDGVVIDSQILTQLSKICLDDGTVVAVPIEDLTTPVLARAPERGEVRASRAETRTETRTETRREPRRDSGRDSGGQGQGQGSGDGDRSRRRKRVSGEKSQAEGGVGGGVGGVGGSEKSEKPKRRRRRQGSKRPRPSEAERARRAEQRTSEDSAKLASGPGNEGGGGGSGGGGGGGGAKKKRRKRRRRRGGGGSDSGSDSGSGSGSGSDSSSGNGGPGGGSGKGSGRGSGGE